MKIKKILKRFFVVLSLLVIIFSLIKIFLLVSNQTVFELLKTPKTKPLCQDCNIIMISLDTLGAKHLPCYGYSRDTAPNLCKFANENILFKNAFSNASWTLPSHVSIFTSLYPSYHKFIGDYYDPFGFGNNFCAALSSLPPFLPEILQKNGYETYFYIPMDYSLLTVAQRGVTKITFSGGEGSGDLSYFNDALNSFLANVKEGKKTFTFLHTYAVHAPYFIENKEKIYTTDNLDNIPLSWEELMSLPFTEDFYQALLIKAALYKEDDFYKELKKAKTLGEAEKILNNQGTGRIRKAYYDYYYYLNKKIFINDKRHIEYLQALYDQRIHELDDFIGKTLIPFLENPAIKNNTMVIITSDHGEEFMEHGAFDHSTLYETNVRVPLIFSVPGVTKKTITTQVQSVDIVPTLLDVVGISREEYLFQGYSLVDVIQKNTNINRLLFAGGYLNESNTIRKDNWKLFLIKERERYLLYELYDTVADPDESNNLLTTRMDIVNKIKEEAEAYEEKWLRLLP